jgi:hypothetical protein
MVTNFFLAKRCELISTAVVFVISLVDLKLANIFL